MAVGEQLVYFARLHGLSPQAATTSTSLWLERLGVAAHEKVRLDTLSLGNQQRVQLAAALVHEPELGAGDRRSGVWRSLAVGFDRLPEGTPVAIGSALLWLVLGFAFYSFAYATAASLASRQEDAQSATMLLAVVVILSYFAGAGAASEPGALPVRVLSFLPPTAPIAMPARASVGGVEWWEVPVAIAVVLVATYGMARLAAHIYPRVALHSGARLKLRAAWRSPSG